MNARLASVLAATLIAPAAAHAGGLLLPGAGAVSTSRAGAAVASASDGEALVLNPAGLAKSTGTTITVSAAIISYAMEFARRGTYDDIDNESLPFEGQPYPTVRNDAKPELGFGSYQPVPVVAVVSDLGGAVPGLTVAAGLYAPNAYPFRDMCTETAGGCQKYVFNADFNAAPPPNRYDIVSQEASILVPTIAAAYEITDQLDVGARFGLGFAHLKSTVSLWGSIDNYTEDVRKDSLFTLDANASLIPVYGFGVAYRPTPLVELAANYSSKIGINAKGDASAEFGPGATLMGNPIVLRPASDVRCDSGGTNDLQRGCVELEVPMSVTIGGRYKFLDRTGKERGDIELNLGWENWGAERASNYRVVVDADVYLRNPDMSETRVLAIEDSFVRHGFQNTYNARLGGSYNLPAGESADVILRGGVGYDTAAARKGWLRTDVDGAARTTVALGAGYRAKRFEVNIGGGLILEGTNDNEGLCNTSIAQRGCGPSGAEQDVEDRTGPDPITPVVDAERQSESPVNQGTITSHYVMFMLGFSTWF